MSSEGVKLVSAEGLKSTRGPGELVIKGSTKIDKAKL